MHRHPFSNTRWPWSKLRPDISVPPETDNPAALDERQCFVMWSQPLALSQGHPYTGTDCLYCQQPVGTLSVRILAVFDSAFAPEREWNIGGRTYVMHAFHQEATTQQVGFIAHQREFPFCAYMISPESSKLPCQCRVNIRRFIA
jgi:hypothetical protein